MGAVEKERRAGCVLIAWSQNWNGFRLVFPTGGAACSGTSRRTSRAPMLLACISWNGPVGVAGVRLDGTRPTDIPFVRPKLSA